jgi:hypothetical protein
MAGLVYKQATPSGVYGARPTSRRSGTRALLRCVFPGRGRGQTIVSPRPTHRLANCSRLCWAGARAAPARSACRLPTPMRGYRRQTALLVPERGARDARGGTGFVSPLQGSGDFGSACSRPFRPGYHIAGFQPAPVPNSSGLQLSPYSVAALAPSCWTTRPRRSTAAPSVAPALNFLPSARLFSAASSTRAV